MAEKTMRDAINEALHQAMAADESVFVIGEDVAGCNGSPSGKVGEVGGVVGVTSGLYKAFGPNRCIDTPISESAIVGAAAGAAHSPPARSDAEAGASASSAHCRHHGPDLRTSAGGTALAGFL